MGGKSGGGASTPYEAPNTLSTAQSLRILDAVSEGEVEGFANGNDDPFKSVFFNDTPVQNADGSYNFKGVNGYFLRGTKDQVYVPEFAATERSVAVSTEVKKNIQVVRAITDSQITRLRVTVGVNRNVQVSANGDTNPTVTNMLIELVDAKGVQKTQRVVFREKSSGVAYVDYTFDKLPAVPFNLRVTRTSADPADSKTSNETYFSSYVEIIDAKLNYPHTALAALELDSDQFGSSTPRRNYLIKGRLVQVPSNYDPEKRTYSTALWDGSFKLAWTNNPAWVFYDLLTSKRFSTLAHRLGVSDIDKWSLYKVAQYCDHMVDDGFGGKEPRFVCNAYISEQRQAAELLTDLASVFRGLAVWNGNQISVTLDMDSDPVASYTNSNVVDGSFSYSSSALKAIHTAVHVQYVDKYDGYRTKTEYVDDAEAVKRYGLNPKSVTAFGCDSRGQANRLGAWILQTELRQQHAINFTVGREGLKHLPYDVIQVADNDYAGAQISGRVLKVEGLTLTLDREVTNVVGAKLSYVTPEGVQSVEVASQPAKDKVQLKASVSIAEMDTWVLSEPVKSRLYRAISIAENTQEGTYNISALLHDPNKYETVDGWSAFDKEITTLHTLSPELVNAAVQAEGGDLKVTWGSTDTAGEALTYEIKLYRNGKLIREFTADTPELALEGLADGDYYAEIRGRNARGVLSDPKVVSWSINYTLTGLRTTPKMFAIELNWSWPNLVVTKAHAEIWYSKTNDITTATKLATLPHPQSTYTLNNVAISDRFYFWARMGDDMGRSGGFTNSVVGTADNNPVAIVELIQKEFTESGLTQDLLDQLNNLDASWEAEVERLDAESANLVKALEKEVDARVAAVNEAKSAAASDLLAKAKELGTKITSVESTNATQAQQIQTVTAAHGNTAAALQREVSARAEADAAEVKARELLAVRMGSAEGSILSEQKLRIEGDTALGKRVDSVGTRMGAAESAITTLRDTTTKANEARATEASKLEARLGNIGTRNYLLNSGVERTTVGRTTLTVSDALVAALNESREFMLSVNADLAGGVDVTSGTTRIGTEVRLNYTDGTYQYKGTWAPQNEKYNRSGRLKVKHTVPDGKTVKSVDAAMFQANYSKVTSVRLGYPKLEIGSVATDWTPAPEDGVAAIGDVSASLLEFKDVQVKQNEAFTNQLKTAKSQYEGNTATIQTLQSTKANKDEVASLARTTLSSEWSKAAVDAANKAQTAAAADAKMKADAALLAAEKEAQTKAAAAEAAAIAAAKGDAASKADAAEAAAIADAAAKDAIIKKQAADDATAKADKAKADAIAEAKRLTTASDAKITKLEQTFTDGQKSVAEQFTQLRARHNAGANLLPDSEFKYGFEFQNFAEVKTTKRSIGLNLSDMRRILGANVGYVRRNEDLGLNASGQPNKLVLELGRVPVERGKVYQLSCWVQAANKELTETSIYARPLKDGAWNSTGVKQKWLTISNAPVNGAASTLDTMTRLAFNYQLSEDAPQTELGISFNFGVSTEGTDLYQFFTRPMICEVPDIDAPIVPYSPGPDPTVAVSEASFTEYKSAQVTKDAATATEIRNVQASIGGANLLPNSELAMPDSRNIPDRWHMTNNASIVGYHNLTNSSWAYRLRDVNVAGYRDMRDLSATQTGNKNAYINCLERVSVVAGQIYQFSVYLAGWNLAPNAGDIIYLDFRDVNDVGISKSRIKRGDFRYGSGSTVGNYGRGTAAEGYATLDKFKRFYFNEQIPEGVAYINVGIAKRTAAAQTGGYLFYAKPMLCEVSSLDAPPMAYAPRGNTGAIQEVKSVTADLSGKVSAMYSMKVETISGGRKVVAGLALGADGATGDSQALIYANKFGIVDPNSKGIKVPFVVETENGKAKVVLDGDLYAAGSVLGSHIAANQSFKSPLIQGGRIEGSELSIGDGNATISSDGTASFTDAYVSGYADIQGGVFRGEVLSHNIQGDNMRIYRFKPHDGYRAKIELGSAPRPRIVYCPPWMLFKAQGGYVPNSFGVKESASRNVYASTWLNLNSSRIANFSGDAIAVTDKASFSSSTRTVDFEHLITTASDTNGTPRTASPAAKNGWHFVYNHTLPRSFVIPPNQATTLWLGMDTPAGDEGFYASTRQKFVDECVNNVVMVSYMDYGDGEYDSYFAAKKWSAVIDPRTLKTSGISVQSTGVYRCGNYIILPEGCYGVSFEYYGDGNTDWKWGLQVQTQAQTYNVKSYSKSNHVTTWTTYAVTFPAAAAAAVISLQKHQGWQWFNIRNLKIYTI